MIQYPIVLNGLGSGSSLQRLLRSRMDPAVLRPWAETDKWGRFTGRNFITVNVRGPDGQLVPRTNKDGSLVLNAAGNPVPLTQNFPTNAPATLRQTDWLQIDKAVTFAAKKRLRFWADLYGTNPFNVPGGLGAVAVQHAVADGDASATISMDPIRKGERSRPLVDTALIPLPVIHSDGSFSAREIAATQNSGGMQLDITGLRLSARKVAETVEQLALGTASSYTYAGGTVYGLTNFPYRSTKSLAIPTGSNNALVVSQVGAMVQTLRDNLFFGPFVAYYSNSYAQWMDLDYSTAYPGITLGDRMRKINGISEWRNVDYLSGYQIIVVQMTEDVAEGMQAMGITTVQWEEQGGFEQCFKVLCIQVPRFRANYNGVTGIVHGTGS